jgi:carbon-monoxide dehydrogenase medium subunit
LLPLSEAARLPPFDLYAPQNLSDALKFIESGGASVTVVASGTDLLPRLRRRQIAPSLLMDISFLRDDLRYIRQEEGVIHVGALTTVTDLLESPLFGGPLSMVQEAAEKFGAPQIRNVATVGGNVCSASSSEDLIPVFLALDAEVKLISSGGERSVPLKDFIIGKRATAMKPSEILAEIHFESPRGHNWSAFEKLGRRNILIVSLVGEAVALSLEDDLATVSSVRIALNRVAGRVPALAAKTEECLTGRKLSDETIAEAQRTLASELKLTSDFRGSAAYRTEVAQVYLKRLIQRCAAKIKEFDLR